MNLTQQQESELQRGVEIALAQIIQQFDRGASVEELIEDWGFPGKVIEVILLTRPTRVGRA